ncbi:MAG: class I SAM-dependent methyltransferase [Desulfomicrobium sp.]|nr:class I SAM-dependent methyltransferase [Desulfomicrobium sp.]
MICSAQVAKAHNAMAMEYDIIHDLWYPHLLNTIHDFIITHLPNQNNKTALDVGCGTGLQSLLLAHAGYKVKGFDLADKLIDVALLKTSQLDSHGKHMPQLYKSPQIKNKLTQMALLKAASKLRQGPIIKPDFFVADATSEESYYPGNFDVIVCCGSVLSFIDKYDQVLAIISGALRKGGLLFLEVEHRFSLDLLWPLIDIFLHGALGYRRSFREVIKTLAPCSQEPPKIVFPFFLSTGECLDLPMRLFSTNCLSPLFKKHGLKEKARLGIHSITNIIPSTILHKQKCGKILKITFAGLSTLEKKLNDKWPCWKLGSSIMYALEK